MDIRIETQRRPAGTAPGQSRQAVEAVRFADVLKDTAGEKQKHITEEQVAYFRSKYLDDRVLRPEEAQSLLGELDQLVEIDPSLTGALASASAKVQEGPVSNGWSADKFMKYTDILKSISVDAEENPNLMQALIDSDGYSWTNAWGQMGMLSNGQVVQQGPGINLASRGERQLTEQEVRALREKYMADGSLSAADARFLIGELSSMGAIDGRLAWDLLRGETFSRDFSRARIAAIPAEEGGWTMDLLLDYLRDRHLMFQAQADEARDLDRWNEHTHWAGQVGKLSAVFTALLSA